MRTGCNSEPRRLRLGCRQGSGGSATALTETGGTLVTAAAEAGRLRASAEASLGEGEI